MTEKELLYYEDALGHEDNLISIIKESIKLLEDERLINFLKNQEEIHQKNKNSLKNLLEDKNNE